MERTNVMTKMVIRWVTVESRPTLQPGPDEGKGIWTTSVYCYCPGSGGPGGGLDDHELVIGGWGDKYHTFIQFYLTELPTRVSSVRLELFAFTQRGVGTTKIYLDRITEFWDWKTQGTGHDLERPWWADRPAAVLYRAQGRDRSHPLALFNRRRRAGVPAEPLWCGSATSRSCWCRGTLRSLPGADTARRDSAKALPRDPTIPPACS